MRSSLRSILSLGASALLLGLVACASGGSSTSTSGSTSSSSGGESSTAATSESTAAAKPPKGVPAPAGSKLAQVTIGMKPDQVKAIMGEPTSQTTYMTGKAWIPWYFGPTHQTDWKYKGTGRVVFVNNRWSGAIQSVERIDYDPNEAGQ